jgi:Cu+-exporting ATPase
LGLDEAFLRFLAVLVISCPCALGLATPLAKVAAMALCRSRGILVRDPAALERARDLNTIVFDKTGTLTEGRYLLRNIVAPGLNRRDVLCLLAAVESHSDHFLAREIVNRARQENAFPGKAEHFKEYPGLGVSGFWDGKEVFIGNRRLMIEEKMLLPARLEEQARSQAGQGMTAVFFGWGRVVRGLLAFGDSLKVGAREMIQTLSARGVDVWMVSGDTEETTRSVARSLGIGQFRGQILPREKAEWVRTLQREGRRVGMVGDGINDAAALAQADVGFAVGTAGANLLREASDLTLLHPDPGRVVEALALSALTVKTIRQNLFFSFFYNGLGIPLAMAGILNPLLAACAMFISSLTVIGNALRITRRQSLRLPSSQPPQEISYPPAILGL